MNIAIPMSGWGLIAIVISQVLWIAASVSIARTKTTDPIDRIAWLLIVLFFNILGVVIYLLFAPREKHGITSLEAYDEDVKRRANEGTLKRFP